MTLTPLVFVGVAFFAVLGALLLVFHRNAMVATLSMAVAMVCLGVLYILLRVPFLGLFQMIVYAGAVMVIVLYILMALGQEESGPPVGMPQTVAAYVGALLFLLQVYRVLLRSGAGSMPEVDSTFGTIQSFGTLLVEKYAVPFELASLLLLGAMVGAVILSRRQWT